MNNRKAGRSPNYYIRKRLQSNRPAMAGLFFIIFSSIIALFAYLLMPDNTPDANDGAIQIQKKPPGFKVQFIKIRKNYEVRKRGFLHTMISGQESRFTIIPVSSYFISGSEVIYIEYGRDVEKKLDLVQTVLPVFKGDTNLIENSSNYTIRDDSVFYVNNESKLVSVTISSLQETFENNHIETRIFWMGTDRSGRDLLSRLIYGTRISLSIGLVAVLISVFLGLGLGAMGGFMGGWIDDVILWVMSVVWSIPGIMLVIAISIALQSRGVWVAFIAVGLTMWVDVGRVIRGQILAIKRKNYIEAARALGLRNFRIVYIHILPNIVGPLVVIATANFAAAILLEAGLSFLGLSVQPPTPSWGSMIFDGFNVLGTKNSWHLIVFPGMAISLMVLSFNLLGNGLRDAIDPKTILKS